MEPSLNLLAILNLLGVGQAVLFACALAGTRRGEARSNRLLAALLFIIAVILTWNILLHTGYLPRWPHLAQLHVPLQFLIGPLVYLYLRSLLDRRRGLKKTDLLHLLPAVACAAYLLPFYLQGGEYKAEYLRAAYASYPFEWRVRTALVLALGGVYLLLSLSLPGLLPRRGGESATRSGGKADLFWARAWACAFGVTWLVGCLRLVFDYNVRSNLIVPLLFTIFVNAAVYLRLRRAEITDEARPTPAPPPETQPPARKYERSTLTPERAERYVRRLLEVMEAERPYTDGELTLQKLAERLSVSPHHLSQLINERLGQNFTDFVNSYRVEEAKRRLVDPRQGHYSILAIAESVGFNSKSAFNAVFKKHARMTPSEWRKSQTEGSAVEQTLKASGDA